MPLTSEQLMAMQMISGMGGAMDPEGFAGQMNQVNQSVIGGLQQTKAAENKMSLLKMLIGGGADIKLNKEGFTSKIDSKILGEMFRGDSGSALGSMTQGLSIAPSEPAMPPGMPTAAPVPSNTLSQSGALRTDIENPSSSPVTNVDLTGLTPKDITEAFQLKMTSDQITQKGIVDASTGRLRSAQIAELESGGPATTAQKNYALAQRQGFPGSFVDFQNSSKTAHQKDYAAAVKGGYESDFNTWLTDMAKAGAINLGDFTARKEAAAGVKAETYFTSPDFSTDVEKYVNDNQQRTQWEGAANSELKKAQMKKKFIESKIVSSGGKIIGKPAKDGRILTWTVKFKGGKREISYAF